MCTRVHFWAGYVIPAWVLTCPPGPLPLGTYCGSAINFKSRWSKHKTDMTNCKAEDCGGIWGPPKTLKNGKIGGFGASKYPPKLKKKSFF